MSNYLNNLKNYKINYNISLVDHLKLVALYPIFKMQWLSENGKGMKKIIAKNVLPLFIDCNFSNKVTIGSNKFKMKISFRPDSLNSFKEIFWGGEYITKNKIENIKSFVDLGANTGMATIHFMSRFNPNKVLCIEGNYNLIPNLELIKKQMKSNCDFIIENKCITGNYNGPITFLISDNHRDSKVVFEKIEGGVNCEAESFRSVLDRNQIKNADLLKMDIEGGEYDIIEKDKEVFKRFNEILVEIHGNDEKRSFFREQIQNLGFDLLEIKSSPEYLCEISHFKKSE